VIEQNVCAIDLSQSYSCACARTLDRRRTQGEGDVCHSRAGDLLGSLGAGDLGLDLLQQERRLTDALQIYRDGLPESGSSISLCRYNIHPLVRHTASHRQAAGAVGQGSKLTKDHRRP
jgi:hypothetical protein